MATKKTFTFHYGPIQITVFGLLYNRYFLFTFHYGPIQMTALINVIQTLRYLYSTMVLFK